MRVELVIRSVEGSREKHIREFVVEGEPSASGGHSAMAKTVGYPIGIAVKMILDDRIKQLGVIVPFAREIYEPILAKLQAEGLSAKKSVEKL